MTVPIRCANHPDRGALAYCGACGRPLCRDCVVRLPSGNLCTACAEAPPGPARARRRGAPAWIWAAAAGVGFTLWWISRWGGP